MNTQFKWRCIQRSTTSYLNIRWPTTLFGGPRFQVAFIIWLLAALPAARAAETTPLSKLSTYVFKMIVYGTGENISYSVEAYDDGKAEYQGFEFVKTKGRVRFQINPEALANLRTDFESIGFFGFDSVYQATPSFAYRNKREVLFEMRFGEKLKSVTYYRLQGRSAAWKQQQALFEASRLRIPLTDLLCPYVLPWPDPNAGMELCSGRPIISRDEWAERLRQCMTNSSGNETAKYISCSSQQMYTERELQERLNK